MPSRLSVVRIFCLLGLVASGAGLGEALFAAHEFCGFGEGCDIVAESAYARPLGVPLPVVGLAGFALVLGLSLVPRPGWLRLLRLLALAGGLAGLALVAVQVFVLGHVCWVCLVADLAGVGLAAFALPGRFAADKAGGSGIFRAAWLGAAALAAGGPVFWDWAAVFEPPPPAQVVALWVPGKTNVVEVTDFDCPHCRRAEPVVREAVAGNDRVHFVRLVALMPQHRNARPAGRAYLAAVRQGKGEEMASALFAADDRSAERCRQLAKTLGLDLLEYDRVIADERTDAQLDTTSAWVRNAAPLLPLTWVQDHLIQGVPTPEAFQAALRRAERK